MGDETALARHRRRFYRLGLTPKAAVELLAESGNVAIYSAQRARRTPGDAPFAVLRDTGFTIYQPWTPNDPGNLSMGPAVRGRLVPTSTGARLDVSVRRYAPLPSQHLALRLATFSYAAVLLMFATTGLTPFLFVLAVGVLSLLGLMFYDHARRARDVKDLLSIIERTYGPLALPTGDDAPHRRDDG